MLNQSTGTRRVARRSSNLRSRNRRVSPGTRTVSPPPPHCFAFPASICFRLRLFVGRLFMFPNFRLPHPTRDRRLIAAMLLLVAAASGITFSVPRPIVRDLSTPFPCMSGHACSCRDAEMCWRQCGCFSDDQKLAWAAARGVTPPVWFAALRLARQTDAPQPASCCRSPQTETCNTTATCCSTATCKSSKTCRATDAASTSATQAEDDSRLPSEISQRGCQRLDRLFVLLSLVLPVEPKPEVVELTASDRLGRIRSDFYLGTEVVPPKRPPEPVSG